MPASRRLSLLAALCALLWAGSAFAYDDSPFSPGGSTLLELGRYQTDLHYPTGDKRGHVGRYGLGFNQPVSDVVAFELHGGYAKIGRAHV